MPERPVRMIAKALFTLAITLCSWGQSAVADDWYQAGEVLTFNVSYRMGFFDISAGQAELHYAPGTDHRYTLTARAWNRDGVKGIIQMRDRIVAKGQHGSAQSFLTDTYTLRLNENDYKADKLVIFDRKNATTSYTNRRAPNEPAKVQPLKDHARDLFSALYSLRMSAVETDTGKVYTLPIRELDRALTLQVKVLGHERLETKAGTFNALHVQPVTMDGPDGRKKDRLHIWVTDDARHMPLRIELRMALGAFTGELASYGGLNTPSRAPEDLPLSGDVTMTKEVLPHANPL